MYNAFLSVSFMALVLVLGCWTWAKETWRGRGSHPGESNLFEE